MNNGDIVVAHFSFGDSGSDASFNFKSVHGSHIECGNPAGETDAIKRTAMLNQCETKKCVGSGAGCDKESDIAMEGDLDNDVVKWRKVGGSEGQTYKWDLYVIGECRVEEINGNMAWHVTNSAERDIKDGCSIATKELFYVPQDGRYQHCKFSMLVRDVDYHGAKKDSKDKMCIKVLDHKNAPIDMNGFDEICARDDHVFDVKMATDQSDSSMNRRLIDRSTVQSFDDRNEQNIESANSAVNAGIDTHFLNDLTGKKDNEKFSDQGQTFDPLLAAKDGALRYRRHDQYWNAGKGEGDKLANKQARNQHSTGSSNNAMGDKSDTLNAREGGTKDQDESMKVSRETGILEEDTLKFIAEEHENYWYHEELRGEKDSSDSLGDRDSNTKVTNYGGIVTTPYVPIKKLAKGIRIQLRALTDHNWEHWYADDIKIICGLTKAPTHSPTAYPTPSPTAYPTPSPTTYPTPSPTTYPTPYPTPEPTTYPTPYPTPEPTTYPTPSPTAYPTPSPTPYPTPEPTTYPTPSPTTYPTPYPTPHPTPYPTPPTSFPTPSPTAYPTPYPTPTPTSYPTPYLEQGDECKLTWCTYKIDKKTGRGHTLIRGFTRVGERFHCERKDGHINKMDNGPNKYLGAGKNMQTDCMCKCGVKLDCSYTHHTAYQGKVASDLSDPFLPGQRPDRVFNKDSKGVLHRHELGDIRDENRVISDSSSAAAIRRFALEKGKNAGMKNFVHDKYNNKHGMKNYKRTQVQSKHGLCPTVQKQKKRIGSKANFEHPAYTAQNGHGYNHGIHFNETYKDTDKWTDAMQKKRDDGKTRAEKGLYPEV